jgi:GH18 family chitinase
MRAAERTQRPEHHVAEVRRPWAKAVNSRVRAEPMNLQSESVSVAQLSLRLRNKKVVSRIHRALQLLAGFLAVSPICHSQAVTPPPTQILAAYYGATPNKTTLAELISSGAAAHLTHLIYAFAASDSSNPCTAAPLISASDLASLKTLRSRYPAIKILVSVGGEASGAEFQAVAGDTSFARDCVGFLMADTANGGFQFDGVDIDWETPSNTTDEQNFNALLKSFRAALNQYQTKHSIAEHLLLTAAFSPEHTVDGWLYIDFAGQKYPPGATSSVDFFNAEFYEYAYVGDGVAESNAPLYEIDADLYGNANTYGADEGIITNGKVPPNKIALGIPFYGIHYTGVTGGGAGAVLGHAAALQVDANNGAISYPYYTLRGEPGTLYNDANGSTDCGPSPEPASCDGIGASAWIWNSSSSKGDFWDFDNAETIGEKAQYAQDHVLAGLMSWNLMQDTSKGALLSAMTAGLAANHLIIGAGGNVWGINAAGQIYQRASSTWTAVPGSVLQLAVGPTGDVWALNFAGDVLHWVTGGSPNWQQVNGTFKQIAVGTNYLWAVTANGEIYYTASKPESSSSTSKVTWTEIGGTFASIVLDPASDTDVWAVDSVGEAYEYGSGSWTDRGSYSQLAVASSTNVAALDALGNVYKWNGSSWQSAGRKLSQLAIAPSGDIWGISSSSDVWHLPAGSSAWSRISGRLREIAYGTNLWGLNAQGEIYTYSGSRLTRVSGTL